VTKPGRLRKHGELYLIALNLRHLRNPATGCDSAVLNCWETPMPLSGVKVLDHLTRVLSDPFCTALLAT
jgi:hypothetical protein